MKFFNYKSPFQVMTNQIKRSRTVEMDILSKLGLCRNTSGFPPFYGRCWRYQDSPYLNNELELPPRNKKYLFPPGFGQGLLLCIFKNKNEMFVIIHKIVAKRDLRKIWYYQKSKNVFPLSIWSKFIKSTMDGVRESRRQNIYAHVFWRYIEDIAIYLNDQFQWISPSPPLGWLLKHLQSIEESERLEIKWIKKATQAASSYVHVLCLFSTIIFFF
ncbi:MAG: hypothetical protein GY714_23260 [Desulfobacterales bacterium]|nr:hypothetical protein [Desulfobacterales bacterium]